MDKCAFVALPERLPDLLIIDRDGLPETRHRLPNGLGGGRLLFRRWVSGIQNIAVNPSILCRIVNMEVQITSGINFNQLWVKKKMSADK